MTRALEEANNNFTAAIAIVLGLKRDDDGYGSPMISTILFKYYKISLVPYGDGCGARRIPLPLPRGACGNALNMTVQRLDIPLGES